MGYAYENSDPERFQHLCQSLLLSDFPDLQCLPVGQPDGGRDAIALQTKNIVQVKFRRSDEEESADWLIQVLERERPKIARLVDLGIENYLIMTNARGTAHLGTGRIDQVQQWLDTNIDVPARCYWRDDLDRRLDRAELSLKLKYSELMTLEDGLEVLLAESSGIIKERQRNAIRAFVGDQYREDSILKFKQLEMSDELIELFVDVPIGYSDSLAEKIYKRAGNRAFLREPMDTDGSMAMPIYRDDLIMRDETYISPYRRVNRMAMGAAEFLLSEHAQEDFMNVVIEGAPGQGKSTIAQYVCQAHRARYLGKTDLISQIPPAYIRSAFRLPIKVDLRDYASFLNRKSPFELSEAEIAAPRTLEIFLSRFISYTSGGISFDAADVASIFSSMPTLLFLDGLDEVADVDLRQELVNSVGSGMTRLKELGADMQIVVTSRPSILGKSRSLAKYGFDTFVLGKLDRRRIDEYASKWMLSRRLQDSDKQEVRNVLGAKLELPHIQSLTTNPMQLAILLSLIRRVGYSLPDQRTDLYRRYVDLFLTREADKSADVREYRQILLEFVRYLAWVLQIQAESSRTSGSMSAAELEQTVRTYLSERSHSSALADRLFHGGLARIFVLVERIDGMYEFEVQPLREFFCAQYLYSTSPIGTYRDPRPRGDRAQRFEALASNPFWFNVARFYAGLYESGEIGTLVVSLQELVASEDQALSIHARRVSIALLQDWVFSNKKYAQDQLIKSVFDSMGTFVVLNGNIVETAELQFEPECGQETFREILFVNLNSTPVGTRSIVDFGVLRQNGGEKLAAKYVDMIEGASAPAIRTRIIKRIFLSGGAKACSDQEVWKIINSDIPDRIELLDRCVGLIDEEAALALRCSGVMTTYVKAALDGVVATDSLKSGALGVFADVVIGGNIRRLRYMLAEARVSRNSDKCLPSPPAAVADFVTELSKIDFSNEEYRRWSDVVETIRNNFGDCWAFRYLAISSAGIKTPSSEIKGVEALFNESYSICARARSARIKKKSVSWWRKQLSEANCRLDEMFWVGLVLMWSSVENLIGLASDISMTVDRFSDEEFRALFLTFARLSESHSPRNDRRRLDRLDLTGFSAAAAALIWVCFSTVRTKLEYSKDQYESEYFAQIRKREFQGDIADIPSWGDMDSMTRWLKKIFQMRLDGYVIPVSVWRNIRNGRPSDQFSNILLHRMSELPFEVVAPCVMSLQRKFRPLKLGDAMIQGEWTFE